MATLTSANSALALAVANLFAAPQVIRGYSTDDSFAADDVSPAQTEMGVDGRLSGGYTPVPSALSIVLQADSPSNDFFDTVVAAMQAAREVYIFNGSIFLPATNNKYALTRGFLTSYTPLPPGKKILQPRKYTITFESITKANT